MLGGWSMQGGQTKQGEHFIALTHEDHKPIIFDRVLKAGNSVLLATKMVIRNPEEINAAIVNGKQSKEYFHRVTGHAGHHLMDATAKYYKVNLTGKVNNCLSCSLEKIRQKNIPKKNEDKCSNPGERIYLDISSMRKPSMGGRQHWVMLVDEATKYKKSFFLKNKNEQVEPIIDWIKALKQDMRSKSRLSDVIMLERIKSWKESQTRMIWGLFLNIQPQGHHSSVEWWREHL